MFQKEEYKVSTEGELELLEEYLSWRKLKHIELLIIRAGRKGDTKNKKVLTHRGKSLRKQHEGPN